MQYVDDQTPSKIWTFARGLLLGSLLTVTAMASIAHAEFKLPSDARPVKKAPALAELQTLVEGITLRLPTVGKLIQEAINHLEDGTYRVFETDPLYNPDPNDPNTWAHSHASKRDKNSLSPAQATTLLWHGFYMFPLFDDQSPDKVHEHHSQTEILLHETIHILLADTDCARADRISRKLYRLGRSKNKELNLGISDPQLQAVALDMNRLKAFDSNAFFEATLDFYVQAKALDTACADFNATPITVTGITVQLPALPASHRPLIGFDPFLARYREKCLDQLPRGYLLKAVSTYACNDGRRCEDHSGIFREPLFLGHLLEYVGMRTVRVVLSEQGVGIHEPKTFQNALMSYSGFFEAEKHHYTLPELELALPGFQDWRDVFLDTNPDLAPSQQSIRIDAQQIMMLPLRGLNAFSGLGGGMIGPSQGPLKTGLGMTFETNSPNTRCQVTSKGSSEYAQKLDESVSVSCASGTAPNPSVKTYSLTAEYLLRYWMANPHYNPNRGVDGKATMLEDSFYLTTELL